MHEWPCRRADLPVSLAGDGRGAGSDCGVVGVIRNPNGQVGLLRQRKRLALPQGRWGYVFIAASSSPGLLRKDSPNDSPFSRFARVARVPRGEAISSGEAVRKGKQSIQETAPASLHELLLHRATVYTQRNRGMCRGVEAAF